MKHIIVGNRVPYEYFVTSGTGESDAGCDGLPYETGSYDQALTNAGIQNANIVEYTSVIPTIAHEITKEEGLKRIQWGEVIECIKAQSNGPKGSFVSAAVITTSVYDPSGTYLGGFACEYAGKENKQDAEKSLAASITGIIERRGLGTVPLLRLYQDNTTDRGYRIHPGTHFVYESLKVKAHHGTALACICFVSYQTPLLSGRIHQKPHPSYPNTRRHQQHMQHKHRHLSKGRRTYRRIKYDNTSYR
jgi:pyruvoyl-dependent arginine decarboxylase